MIEEFHLSSDRHAFTLSSYKNRDKTERKLEKKSNLILFKKNLLTK